MSIQVKSSQSKSSRVKSIRVKSKVKLIQSELSKKSSQSKSCQKSSQSKSSQRLAYVRSSIPPLPLVSSHFPSPSSFHFPRISNALYNSSSLLLPSSLPLLLPPRVARVKRVIACHFPPMLESTFHIYFLRHVLYMFCTSMELRGVFKQFRNIYFYNVSSRFMIYINFLYFSHGRFYQI